MNTRHAAMDKAQRGANRVSATKHCSTNVRDFDLKSRGNHGLRAHIDRLLGPPKRANIFR